ncbi:3-hydroxyacyl-CoA dehydrogenase NAD-binding domain-containing protein [Mariniblastus fucicola]|uniref:enoyl-CoA hydratase n=1 Tax=Mariniblastus fucicola TaxID=980251 RepID=A0A5B9P6S7_9BACT|nr:3-hydroxyacyl-CoA dehydrogenase NAD-binding domain-containing protein [Mariniblastus fucicola]QEG20630.1 Fatty acid oxidation complex subunit alpha [Mariniblastus fucicola]
MNRQEMLGQNLITGSTFLHMPSSKIVQLGFPQPDIAVIRMDTPERPGNVLDEQLFAELDSAIESLLEREDLRGAILVSSKPKIFVAGADLRRIQKTADFSDEQVIEFCEQGRAVMRKFSSGHFPTVAAIHGAAVGGGLEIALWCDYRIATDHRATKLGLPEVKLGLVPGWAGTSRLPRLSGFEAAVQLTTSGELISSSAAKEIGMIDAVVPCNDATESESLLEADAIRLLQAVKKTDWLAKRKLLEGPVQNYGDAESIVADAAKAIVANRDVFLFAPTVVLEHLARTATLDAADSEASESIAMAQVYGSPANRGLLHHYFLVRHNHKNPGLVDTSLATQKVSKLGIVGAGLMGESIATRCAAANLEIRLLDANPGAAQSAADRINDSTSSNLAKAIDSYDELEGVDLVIESVVETLNVKKSVLQKIQSAENTPDWIASNTSAIQIESMSGDLQHPESFCGIHFCHPKLMSLVEVICGPDTDEQTVADAVAFVRQLRMMPVAINDCPGFVVNRLLAAMLNESLKLYSEGYSIESIDLAMRDFGFRGGPFEIIDIIGADTCMYAGRSMWENGLKCVSLSPILPRMVKKNLLGRKSGTGFYRYESLEAEGIFDASIDDLLNDYRSPKPDSELNTESIAARILAQVAREASFILEEEIVRDARDIDLCIVHGLSFPAHRGGILFWADQIGIDTLNRLLGDETSPLLQRMELKGLSFHE